MTGTTKITIEVLNCDLKWYKEYLAEDNCSIEYDLERHIRSVGTVYKCAQQYKKMKNGPKDIIPAFMT